ncbi:MAG: lytic transglycosylase F [Piscirickettsiaceae bacterium]|nr:lytic transglycosylase F [Piscirickettsiaceae bacterium]
MSNRFLYTYFLLQILCIVLPANAVEESLNADRLSPSYLSERYSDDLTDLKKRKIIRALVVPGRTDFYVKDGKISGLMVKLLDNYEKALNEGIKREDDKTRIVYIPVDFNLLIPHLLAGKGDIAATFLTITEEREKQVNFASGHSLKVNELIVTNLNSGINLSTVDDLAGENIYVVKGSSYIEHLQLLNIALAKRGLKAINIVEAETYLTSEDILEMVNAGAVDITVIDDFKAKLWGKVLPNIKIHNDLTIHDAGRVGWAIRKSNPELKKHIEEFATSIKKGTLLGNILFNQHYGRDQKLENLQLHEEREKYSKFVNIFKKYGDKYSIDHFKLIAQGYQESALNQDRISHRGAVGMMQLLPSTAADKNVAVKDIDQLENNIHAGAKYMNFLRTRYFSNPDITPENQMFFSWAAYNAGPANVRKMRKLAEEMGLNKNIWFKNVEVAAGRLIGTETVRYVANIYKYYSTYLLLEQKEALDNK